jgi:archaellum component FlaD/FlaE
MKVKELKAALKDLGLSTKGKKADLEARLAEAELPEEEEIEEQVIEEVVEEEITEEIAEEEEPDLVMEDYDGDDDEEEEEVVEEKEDEVIDLGKGAFLVNGAYTVPKKPNTPSMRWNKELYGKKPNGGRVRFDGVHIDVHGQPVEELKE